MEQVVPTSPEAVIAVVADLTTLPAWMTRVEAVERADAERARVRERLGRRTRPFEVEQVERTATTFLLRATRTPFSFVASFRAETAPGGSRVVYTRDLTPSTRVTATLFRLLGRQLRWAWAGPMRQELQRVSALATTRKDSDD